ncbi:MAG: ATP-binding protein [Thermodesulfobacteriota bacterium]
MTAPPTAQLDAVALARSLAHAGVGLFGCRRLAQPDPLFQELAEAYDPARLLGSPAGDWLAACTALARLAPELAGPLGRLLRDFRLQLHDWLLLALAGEIESSHLLGLAVAALQEPATSPRPSLHLAAALGQELFGAERSPLALAQHPLVRAGLWQIEGPGPLPLCSLAVQPRLWAILCGDATPWPDCQPVAPEPPELLPAAFRQELPGVAALIAQGRVRAVVLRGAPACARLAAAQLAAHLGCQALTIPGERWRAEPALVLACRYGNWLPVLIPELGCGEILVLEPQALGLMPVVVGLGSAGAVQAAGSLELAIPAMELAERRLVWEELAGPAAPADWLATALLPGTAIAAVAERSRLEATRRGEELAMAHVARSRAQLDTARLRLLAQPVTLAVDEEALILPPGLARQFSDLTRRCRRREGIWEGLGATCAATKSPGVRILFSGESGTGKTLAAALLANRLAAPLYRLDLAAVMNKYVGETEKNLGLALDAAATSDVILLLDEADALFGRRTDGSETGERYANMLTNFLLTRIESHPGIVILTTNSRGRIDPAFLRRLDAVLEFPLPGVEERQRLWQSHLGSRTPGDEVARLLAGYCDLAGGFIRNAVLAAAACSQRPASQPIEIGLLRAALKDEYRKLGRAFPPQLESLQG